MNITHFRFLIGEGNKPFDVLNDSQFMEELANTNLALKKGDIKVIFMIDLLKI